MVLSNYFKIVTKFLVFNQILTYKVGAKSSLRKRIDLLVFGRAGAKFFCMGSMLSKLLTVTILLSGVQSLVASPTGAQAIVDRHKLETDTWMLKLKMAKSLDVMRAVLAEKPDAEIYRKSMIKEIGTSLDKSWSLKYSIWLMENTNLGKKDTQYVLDFAKKFHLNSKDLARFCYAVVYSNKPVHEKKQFIELALKNIKDPKQKGVANLSLAVLLRGLGDTAVNNARRLDLIKNAIIESAEVKIGNTSVGDIAMEEVYRIKNLSKGRPAPGFSGKDSSGREVKLSNYKNRVVMLVFWSSWDVPLETTQNMLELLKNIEKNYIGKPFGLIGVNRDWITNLRDIEKSGLVAGTTISDPNESIYRQYRVKAPPMCFVIDQKGVIQYQGELGAFASLTVDSLLQVDDQKKKGK